MSGFPQELGDRVRVENVDATTPQAQLEVHELQFKNHGLVIRAEDGRVLFKQPDHEVKVDEVRAELRTLLAG